MNDLIKHGLLLDIDSKVCEIVHEDSAEKRQFLWEEYRDLWQLVKLYDYCIDNNVQFNWKTCMENGWMCLNDLGHFKEEILASGVTEDEWQTCVECDFEYMGEQQVMKYLKEYEVYRERHKKVKQSEKA